MSYIGYARENLDRLIEAALVAEDSERTQTLDTPYGSLEVAELAGQYTVFRDGYTLDDTIENSGIVFHDNEDNESIIKKFRTILMRVDKYNQSRQKIAA